MALPFNSNIQNFLGKTSKADAKKGAQEAQNKKTSCSTQATANNIVLSSLANNPGAGTISQAPAKQ